LEQVALRRGAARFPVAGFSTASFELDRDRVTPQREHTRGRTLRGHDPHSRRGQGVEWRTVDVRTDHHEVDVRARRLRRADVETDEIWHRHPVVGSVHDHARTLTIRARDHVGAVDTGS
jgi:hypothetical protein